MEEILDNWLFSFWLLVVGTIISNLTCQLHDNLMSNLGGKRERAERSRFTRLIKIYLTLERIFSAQMSCSVAEQPRNS